MAKTADDKAMAEAGIIAPDEAPPWPFESKGDIKKLAAAAWEQSNGSMEAFYQLAQEHETGQLDLMDLKASQPEREPRVRGTTMQAPASMLPMMMAGTNEAIARDRDASEADRVVHGQNIQGPAPVARAAAERDDARASRSVAAVDAAMAAGRAAQEEVVRDARVRAAPEVAAARAPSRAEGHVTDGKRTE